MAPALPALVPVTVPPGYHEGDAFVVRVGDQWLSVVVPPSCGPGDTLQLRHPPEHTPRGDDDPATGAGGDDAADPRARAALTHSSCTSQLLHSAGRKTCEDQKTD